MISRKKKTKSLLLLSALTLAAVIILAAVALLSQGLGLSEGIYLAAKQDRHFIVMDDSPVSMSPRVRSSDMFDGLATGDRITIVHDGIAETYPGRTGVYWVFRGEGTGEIPSQVTEALGELGYSLK